MKETWRGWQAHWCLHCDWHLNTMIELNGTEFIVSSVGEARKLTNDYTELNGNGDLYETMVFKVSYIGRDIVQKEMARFTRGYKNQDDAQKGHCEVLAKVKKWLIEGCREEKLHGN
jgi:thiol-disulfide isomerase/thioredoxin